MYWGGGVSSEFLSASLVHIVSICPFSALCPPQASNLHVQMPSGHHNATLPPSQQDKHKIDSPSCNLPSGSHFHERYHKVAEFHNNVHQHPGALNRRPSPQIPNVCLFRRIRDIILRQLQVKKKSENLFGSILSHLLVS